MESEASFILRRVRRHTGVMAVLLVAASTAASSHGGNESSFASYRKLHSQLATSGSCGVAFYEVMYDSPATGPWTEKASVPHGSAWQLTTTGLNSTSGTMIVHAGTPFVCSGQDAFDEALLETTFTLTSPKLFTFEADGLVSIWFDIDAAVEVQLKMDGVSVFSWVQTWTAESFELPVAKDGAGELAPGEYTFLVKTTARANAPTSLTGGNVQFELDFDFALADAPRTPCLGDLNGDNVVDASDLAVLLGAWGGTGIADIDDSGGVNAGDLAILLGAWGKCA